MVDKRAELAAVAVFAALFLGVPPFVLELYPFSTPTMFSFRVHQIAEYEVRDPAGHSLPPAPFGLALAEPHDPPLHQSWRSGYGRVGRATPHGYNVVLDDAHLRALVRARLAEHPDLPFVTVTQRVRGPLDALHVGVVSTKKWRIDR